jgi:hypothetical protein
LTVPLKPPREESWMVAVVDPPGEAMVNPDELEETETASPPPLKAAVCGEPLALSMIVRVPVRLPAAVGVKVTEIEQPAPAAILAPQVFVSVKSPDAAIDVMDKAAVPELITVTACAALLVPSACEAKVRLVAESVTAGAVTPEVVPVPLKAAVWGEPLALSVTVRVPVRAPAAVGVKVTEIVQLAPAATLVPQLLVSAKSPDAAIELSVRAAWLELVSFTACAVLDVPVVCEAKVRLVGDSVAVGVAATPGPLSATV